MATALETQKQGARQKLKEIDNYFGQKASTSKMKRTGKAKKKNDSLNDKIQTERCKVIMESTDTKYRLLDDHLPEYRRNDRSDDTFNGGNCVVDANDGDDSPEPPPTPSSAGYVSPWQDTDDEDDAADSDHEIPDDLPEESKLYLLASGMGSDLIILLNRTEEPFLAHSNILASRSDILANVLEKQADKPEKRMRILDVHIPNFITYLRYLYTNELEFKTPRTPIEALDMFQIVDRCGPSSLRERIIGYISSVLTVDNVCVVMESIHGCRSRRTMNTVLHFIIYNASKVLLTEGFGNLCRSCLERIIKNDNLQADELTVYFAVQNWAERECQRLNMPTTDKNLRDVLGSTVFLVRFPSINERAINYDVSIFRVLTREEQRLVFCCLKGRQNALPSYFCKTPRKHGHLNRNPTMLDAPTLTRTLTRASSKFIAVGQSSSSGSDSVSKLAFSMEERTKRNRSIFSSMIRFKGVTAPFIMRRPETVTFKCSKCIVLGGIQMFGPCTTDQDITRIKITVTKEGEEILNETARLGISRLLHEPIDIPFKKLIAVPVNVPHTIRVSMDSKPTFIGVEGMDKVKSDGVVFTIIDDGSDITFDMMRGQIPGLLFRKTLNSEVV